MPKQCETGSNSLVIGDSMFAQRPPGQPAFLAGGAALGAAVFNGMTVGGAGLSFTTTRNGSE